MHGLDVFNSKYSKWSYRNRETRSGSTNPSEIMEIHGKEKNETD